MGTARPASAAPGRAVSNGKNGQPRAIGQLVDKPWLRALLLSPSVHATMGVAVMGAPNYRELAHLMHKPSSVVAGGFSGRDTPELNAEAFSGPAVAFIPTRAFARMAAALN